MEKEMLGLYISGHPLDNFRDVIEKRTNLNLLEVLEYVENKNDDTFESRVTDNMDVTIGGVISNKKMKITKNNEAMGFFKLEDFYGTIESIVFPKAYSRLQNSILEDIPVIIRGRLSLREDEEPKLICNSIEEIKLKPFEIFKKEITLKASFINPYTFDRALALIASGKIDVTSMMCPPEPVEKLADILADPEKRRGGKIVIGF